MEAMPWLDARIPVLFELPVPAVGVAWLVEGDGAAPAGPLARFALAGDGHGPGCACCAARAPAAVALAALFQGRATGRLAWFELVVVRASPQGRAAVAAALAGDALASARFRAG